MACSEKTMAKPEGHLIAVACRSAADGFMLTPGRPSRVPIAAIKIALSGRWELRFRACLFGAAQSAHLARRRIGCNHIGCTCVTH